jgi:hypothetical protein
VYYFDVQRLVDDAVSEKLRVFVPDVHRAMYVRCPLTYNCTRTDTV